MPEEINPTIQPTISKEDDDDKPVSTNESTTNESISESISESINESISSNSLPNVLPTLMNSTSTTNKDNFMISAENVNNTVDAATNFQLQVIGNVVDECLQEFRISLRNDIQNMHLELLRQFHIQKVLLTLFIYCNQLYYN